MVLEGQVDSQAVLSAGELHKKKEKKVKLTDIIKVWDELHPKNTGDIGFCDLEKAVEKVVGVERDC